MKKKGLYSNCQVENSSTCRRKIRPPMIAVSETQFQGEGKKSESDSNNSKEREYAENISEALLAALSDAGLTASVPAHFQVCSHGVCADCI